MDDPYRLIFLDGGDFADGDWADPEVDVPQGARRLTVSSDTIRWRVEAVDENGQAVDAAGMTVDARFFTFQRNGARSPGRSVVELNGDTLPAGTPLVDEEMIVGATVRPHLTITNPGGVDYAAVYIDSGAILP